MPKTQNGKSKNNNTICSDFECDQLAKTDGLCSRHYKRNWERLQGSSLCLLPLCGNKARRKGYCYKHSSSKENRNNEQKCIECGDEVFNIKKLLCRKHYNKRWRESKFLSILLIFDIYKVNRNHLKQRKTKRI